MPLYILLLEKCRGRDIEVFPLLLWTSAYHFYYESLPSFFIGHIKEWTRCRKKIKRQEIQNSVDLGLNM